jgi:hypothetical protein
MYFDTAGRLPCGSTKGVTSFVTALRDPAKRENPRNLFPAARPQGVTNYKQKNHKSNYQYRVDKLVHFL